MTPRTEISDHEARRRVIQDENRTRAFHTEFTEIRTQRAQRRRTQETPGPLVQFRLTGPMPPRDSTASTSLLRSLCGNSVISVVNPSSFLLNFELSTGHPVKDAHPERAPRVEGSLWPSRNSNHSRTYESFSRNPNYSRTYAKHGGGGAFCEMSSPITPLFSFTMLTSLSISIVGAPTFPFLHVADTFRWPPEGGRYRAKEQVAVSATLALLDYHFFRVCTYK